MSVYAPIGTGYKGIPTYARPRQIITRSNGTQVGAGPDNRSPMQQVAGSTASGLDYLQANGPGRYMGGNADTANTTAVQQTRQAQALRRPGQPAPTGSLPDPGSSANGYNTAGIGYEHYHNALVNQAGDVGPDGRYTGGYLKGMKPAEARNYTQKQWLQLGPAGQPAMINKLSQVYGTPPQPAQAPTPAQPATAPTAPVALPHQRQASPAPATPAPVGTGTVLKPAAPAAAPAPMSLPRPGAASNDPALAARLQAKAPGATVLENGKPWTPPSATASPAAAPPATPPPSLDTLAAGLQVLKGAKAMASAPASPVVAKPAAPSALPLPKKPAAPVQATSSQFTPAQQAGNERMAGILSKSAADISKTLPQPPPTSTVGRIPLPNPETIGRRRETSLPLPRKTASPVAAR